MTPSRSCWAQTSLCCLHMPIQRPSYCRKHGKPAARSLQQMSMEFPSCWSTERRAFSFPLTIPPSYRKCSVLFLIIWKLFESGGKKANLILNIYVSSGSLERRWKFTQPPRAKFMANVQSALEGHNEWLSRRSMVCIMIGPPPTARDNSPHDHASKKRFLLDILCLCTNSNKFNGRLADGDKQYCYQAVLVVSIDYLPDLPGPDTQSPSSRPWSEI